MNIARPANTRTNRIPVTAFFDSVESVERALEQLNVVGFPRDRVEVAVRPAGAERFYGGRGRTGRRDTFRFAGIGGLIGLLYGAVLSLVLVSIPGFQEPGIMAWVQLLGPNFGTITGAMIGAVFGFFRHRKPPAWAARLSEAEDAILVTVIAQGNAEIDAARRILEEQGGRAVQIGIPRGDNT